MSFKHMDVEGALRRLADRKIEEAMKAGKFDNLPGAGKPLELEPIPANENARLMWWALRILKQNDIVPEEVTWRKHIEDLKQRLAAVHREDQISTLVLQINRLVQRLNTLGTNAIASSVTPVSLEAEVARFRQSGPAKPAAAPLIRPHQPAPPAPQEGRSTGIGERGGIRHCINSRCKSRNPGTARFCRRCGAAIRLDAANRGCHLSESS